ncbi:MAG: hypothetical protein WCJ18_11430, partial [Planctomycetota bacterium]
MNFESGILDKTRLTTNLIMLVLLCSNIFFAIQYTENLKQEAQQQAQQDDSATTRIQISRFLKFFIDTVLNTKGGISTEDRLKLENDIHQIHDQDLIKQWDVFVASKDGKEAQVNAVRLMS